MKKFYIYLSLSFTLLSNTLTANPFDNIDPEQDLLPYGLLDDNYSPYPAHEYDTIIQKIKVLRSELVRMTPGHLNRSDTPTINFQLIKAQLKINTLTMQALLLKDRCNLLTQDRVDRPLLVGNNFKLWYALKKYAKHNSPLTDHINTLWELTRYYCRYRTNESLVIIAEMNSFDHFL